MSYVINFVISLYLVFQMWKDSIQKLYNLQLNEACLVSRQKFYTSIIVLFSCKIQNSKIIIPNENLTCMKY